MKIIPENFNKLFFTESTLGNPNVDAEILSIPVEGIFFLKGYPFLGGEIPLSGLFLFRGVMSSRRKMTEYIGDPKEPDGFKDEYEIVDVELDEDFSKNYQIFSFEGLMKSPVAWVDWDIIAESFEFHIK